MWEEPVEGLADLVTIKFAATKILQYWTSMAMNLGEIDLVTFTEESTLELGNFSVGSKLST